MKMSRSFAMISSSFMFAVAPQAEGEDSAPHRLARPSRANMASPHVPLDRGVSSGFKVRAAKDALRSASIHLRLRIPLDCAPLLQEAEELAANQPGGENIAVTVLSLENEFAPEFGRRLPLLWSQPHGNNEFTVQRSNSPMGRTK
jgi:hypothetical protein